MGAFVTYESDVTNALDRRHPLLHRAGHRQGRRRGRARAEAMVQPYAQRRRTRLEVLCVRKPAARPKGWSA